MAGLSYEKRENLRANRKGAFKQWEQMLDQRDGMCAALIYTTADQGTGIFAHPEITKEAMAGFLEHCVGLMRQGKPVSH